MLLPLFSKLFAAGETFVKGAVEMFFLLQLSLYRLEQQSEFLFLLGGKLGAENRNLSCTPNTGRVGTSPF